MNQAINSIIGKFLALAIITIMSMISPVKAEGFYVTHHYNITVNCISQNSNQYRMSFYNSGSGTTFVTFREVYQDGYGPERLIQVNGHSYATVWVNTLNVVITDTEAAAEQTRSSHSPSHGYLTH